MNTILIGINFTEQAPGALKYGLRLAQYFEAELIVAHFIDDKDPALRNLSASDQQVLTAGMESLRKQREDRLIQFVDRNRPKQFHKVIVGVEVRIGSVDVELQRLAEEERVGLLVLGRLAANYWGLIGDTADRAVKTAICPVLIVPEDFDFQGIRRIVYASTFQLEDCEVLLFLQEWLEAFNGRLSCVLIGKSKEDVAVARRKIRVLQQLFPDERIDYDVIADSSKKGLTNYIKIGKSDLVVTLHRHRTLWQSFFESDLGRVIARGVQSPLLVYRQQ